MAADDADRPPEHRPVRPLVALGLATAGFIALLIFGLGMTSLLLDENVIAVRGLGQIPGVVGTTLATAGFAATTWAGVRRARPSYGTAGLAAVAAFLGYGVGVWIGAVGGGADLAAATRAAGGVLTSWFGAVIAGAALVSSWGAVALVRTRAERPRWPWEDPDDE